MADHLDDQDSVAAWWNSEPDEQEFPYAPAPEPVPAPSYEPEPFVERPRKRRRWPIVLAVFFVILVAAGVALAICANTLKGSVQKVQAYAQDAVGNAGAFVDAAKAGDHSQLDQSARAVGDAAHAIQNEMQGTMWSFAEKVPVYGEDVRSVRVLSDVLVDLSDNALMPMAQNADVLQLSNLMQEGRVNVEALQSLTNALQQASPVITRSADTVEALPPAHVPQLEEALVKVKDSLGGASDALEHLSPLIPYLPDMLGANGQPKNYLVLAQNNAEVHACGGFIGDVAMMTVVDGNINMGDFEGVDVALFGYGVSAGATEEEMAIFGERIDTHHGDHNITPDFARAGQLYFNIQNILHQQEVDGVLAFDTVFLQYLLGLVGGIDTSYGITVDGGNAASVMLNKCLYWWDDSKVSDAFYDEVAEAAFDKILSNLSTVDTTEFMNVLTSSAAEGRCIMWMRDEGMEAAIQQAGFGWELGHDPNQPVAGIYVSDASAAKMAYYLSMDTELGEPHMNEEGSLVYPVTVTFEHHLDPARKYNLPFYLLCVSQICRSESDLLEELHLLAPAGGYISNLTILECPPGASPSTAPEGWSEASYEGLQTMSTLMQIDAGEVISFSYEVTTAPGVTEPLRLRETPLVPPEIAYWNE